MIYKSLVGIVAFCASGIAAVGPGSIPNVDNLVFHETFDENPFDSGKWFLSIHEKYVDQPVKIMKSIRPIAGFENDLGVQLTQEMKSYAFGTKFSQPFDTKTASGDLVIQYELKFEEPIACGGAYIKLPRVSDEFTNGNLSNETPYSIMFGPDKCGTNNKVHLIVQHQNPVTLQWEEKHYNETIPIKNDKKVHLYTLVISKDNNFDILIDSNSVKKGNLLTHLTPAINPPATIPDETDTKPPTWVDDAQIDDPTAVKPDDWDEDAPMRIPDASAVKPVGWADDAPLKIPDPEAVKPADWDDEEDGEWEAPTINNPICEKIGCGVWTPPTIKNPAYKGKWRAPKIPNPDFIGVWAPRQIPNPAYFEDKNPFISIAPIAGIAVEVWTTTAGIHFDNFIIANSLSDALAFARDTFKPKAEAERKQVAKEDKTKRVEARQEMLATGGFRAAIEVRVMELVEWFNENPWALVASILAIVIPFFYALIFGVKNTKVRREKNNSESNAAESKDNTASQDESSDTTGTNGPETSNTPSDGQNE